MATPARLLSDSGTDDSVEATTDHHKQPIFLRPSSLSLSSYGHSPASDDHSDMPSPQGRGQYQQINKRLGSPISPGQRRAAVRQSPSSPLPREYAERDFLNPNSVGYGRMEPSPETVQRYSPISFGYNPLFPGQNVIFHRGSPRSGRAVVEELDPNCDLPPPPPSLLRDGDTDDDDDGGNVYTPRVPGGQLLHRSSPSQFQPRLPFPSHFNQPQQQQQKRQQHHQQLILRPSFSDHENQQLLPPPARSDHIPHSQQHQLPVPGQDLERYNNPNHFPQLSDRPRLDITRLSPWQRRRQRPNDDLTGHQNEAAAVPPSTSLFTGLNLRWHKDTNFSTGPRDRPETSGRERENRNQSKSPKNRKKLFRTDSFKSSAEMSDVVRSASEQNTPVAYRKQDQMSLDFRTQPFVMRENDLDKDLPTAGAVSNTPISPDPSSPEIRFSVDQGPRPFFTRQSSSSEDAKTAPSESNKSTASSRARKKMKKKLKKKQKSGVNVGIGHQQQQQQQQQQPESRPNDLKTQNIESRTLPTQLQPNAETKQQQDLLKYHRHLMNTIPSPAQQRREGQLAAGQPGLQFSNPIFLPRAGVADNMTDQRGPGNDPNNVQMTSFGRFAPVARPGLCYDDPPTRLGFSLRQPPPTPPRSPLLQYRWQNLQRHKNPNNKDFPLAANIRAASPESVDSNFSIPRNALNNNNNNSNNNNNVNSGYKPATLPKNLQDLDISGDDSIDQIRRDAQKSDNSEDPILFVDNTAGHGPRPEVPQNNNGYRSSSTSSGLSRSSSSHDNGASTALSVNGELLRHNRGSTTHETRTSVVGRGVDRNFSYQPHSPTMGTFESFREYSLDLDGRPPAAMKVKDDTESDMRKRKRKHMILIITVLMLATLAVAAVVVVAALGPWFGKGILLSKSSPTYGVVSSNVTLKILNRKYHPDLSDPSTPKFAKLSSAFTRELDMAFLQSNMSSLYCGSEVTQFSAGSVVAVATLTFLDEGYINTPEDIETVIKSVDDTHDRKSVDDVITLGEFLVSRHKIGTSLDFMTQREKPKVLLHGIARPKYRNKQREDNSSGRDEPEVKPPTVSEAPVGGVIYQIPTTTSLSASSSTSTSSSPSTTNTTVPATTTKPPVTASKSKAMVTAHAEVLGPPTQQYIVPAVTHSPHVHISNTTTTISSSSSTSKQNSTTTTSTTTTAKPVDDNPFLSQHTTAASSLSNQTTATEPSNRTSFKEGESSEPLASPTTQLSARLPSSETTASSGVYSDGVKTTTTTASPLFTPNNGVISDAPAIPPTEVHVKDVKYHPSDRNVTVTCRVTHPHDWSVVHLKYIPVSESGEVSQNSTNLVKLEPTGSHETATVYSEQVLPIYNVTKDTITLSAAIFSPGYLYHGAIVCSFEGKNRTRPVITAGRLTAAIPPTHPVLEVPIDIVENKEVTPPIVCSTSDVGYPPWELSLQALFSNSLESKKVEQTTEQRFSHSQGPSYGITLSLERYLPALTANGTTLQCQLVSPPSIPLDTWSTTPTREEDPRKSKSTGREALVDQQTLFVVEESICAEASIRRPHLPHPYVCSRYIHCDHGKPTVLECPRDQCFDPVSGECGAQSVFLSSVNGLTSEGLAGLSCTVLHVPQWTRMRIQRHRWGAMFDDVLEVTPQGQVTWYDQSLRMRALTDFRLSSVPVKVELAMWIYNLTCEDEKAYRCEVDRQGDLTLSGASMLQVYARPSTPKLQVPNWLVETRAKRTLYVTCEAVLGKPRATLTLMRRLQHEKHFRPVRFTVSTMQDEGSCLVRQRGVFRFVASDINSYNNSAWLCKAVPSAHAPPETGGEVTSGEQWIHVISRNKCSGQTNSALAIPDQCEHYVRCSREVPSVKACSENTCFNPDTQQCDLTLPQQAPDNLCGDLTGYFPHPYFCNKYIRCDAGREITHDCPAGTIYSSSNRCTANVHDAFCSKYIYR